MQAVRIKEPKWKKEMLSCQPFNNNEPVSRREIEKSSSCLKAMGRILFVLTLLMPPLHVAHGQRLYSTGLRFLSVEAYESIPSVLRTSQLPPMPLSIDLSDRMPLPGSQGSQGSCAAWAVAYAKSYHENIKQLIPNGNRRLMYSPSFIYNSIKIKQGRGCSGGLYMREALQFVVDNGIPLLDDFPYDQNTCSIHPSLEVRAAAKKNKALKLKKIDLSELKKTYILQDLLANALPILIGIQTHRSLHIYTGGNYIPSGPKGNGHAMVIVGYNYEKDAYKIMNSWGQDWGDNGFVWMTPKVLSSIANEAYVLFDEADSSTSWGGYQRCLSNQGTRCCDHMGELAIKAKLCASVANLDRWKLYQWCVETGQPRCCDHLTAELGKEKKACSYSTEERTLELYKECKNAQRSGCCHYLSPHTAQKHNLCGHSSVR